MLQDDCLSHYGIMGQKWGVRRYQNEDGSLTKEGRERYSSSTALSDKNYSRIENIFKQMPLADKQLIDPDITTNKATYFSDKNDYRKSVAFNSISSDGFLVAEKIPEDLNVDNTKGIEIGIGVLNKGKGTGTKLTNDLINWFDNQENYDVIWWPVDSNNDASIKVAIKNGFIKDPLGNNYVYAKDTAMNQLGISDHLAHHGILGQKWGVRRYQNEDGSLTAKGKKHYAKADTKWAKKNTDKITRKTQNKVKKELTAFNKELSKQPGYLNKDGSVSKAAINAYNRKMASLMNTAVGDITSPSGRVVRFVAKRSEVGVQMALADRGYDISQLKNGVWSGGRVAYRSQQLNKIDI